MAFTKIGEDWRFDDEGALEEYLWQNLPNLLSLSPFERQFHVKGQYCDILALDDQHRLVIIELKNVEDRYVVQQLTRYYDALIKEQPFETQVDWQQPIRLIAIAPSFHLDTFIDCEYNKLNIELITFKLLKTKNRLAFRLFAQDSTPLASQLMQELSGPTSNEIIPVASPPRKLLNWLSGRSEAVSQGMLRVRKQVLSFDPRMKEIVDNQAIAYGRGKTMPCAEIRQRKIGTSKFPVLFLWLPDLNGSDRIFRMMIWPHESWETVRTIVYSPKACRTKRLWNMPHWFDVMPSQYEAVQQQYQKTMSADNSTCVLSSLVDLSLQIWLTRYG